MNAQFWLADLLHSYDQRQETVCTRLRQQLLTGTLSPLKVSYIGEHTGTQDWDGMDEPCPKSGIDRRNIVEMGQER